MSLSAAINAGLIKKDGAGKYVPFAKPESSAADAKTQDKQDDKSAEKKSDEPADEGWSSPVVDAITSTVGRELAPSQMEGLVALALTGAEELSDLRANSIAQTLDGVTAEELKASYRTAVQETRAAADAIVVKSGVADPSELYTWLEKNDLNRAMAIRDAFARGQVKPLQQAAKEYAASHGAGMDPADAAYLLDGRHQVTGGKLYRNERGTIMVQINGAQAPMTLDQAIAAGFVKISPR